MPGSRPVSPFALAVLASAAVFVLGAPIAHGETADERRLRQLAGQAVTYAGEVRALLAKGADPNVPDRDGRTAVHGAASIGAVESMQALLEAGGDPNRRDKDGNTPLHIAAAASSSILVSSIMSSVTVTESIALIRVMLSACADANIANGDGQTPLYLAAASHDQPGGVAALLRAGADPCIRDGRGFIPNPTLPAGGRRHKHHQWFTPEHGHPRLKEHLEGVMVLMRVSSSWQAFRKNMDIAYPKQSLNREFPFGAE